MKKNKGITLISLIITVILLLILMGISVLQYKKMQLLKEPRM